jgi:tRNA A-37 threonylcarbamoyl transferase component Bud32/tetratricopeptide (TPR) repeat protein
VRDLADELLQGKVKARLFGGDHAPRLGRLVILDRIGSGAMGTVYAAYDPRLDRKVAVKVLHAADAEANARFLREARALGKLAHPNVVAIHDAGEDAGCVYVVMELADGVPLRAWIGTPRAWRDVARVMREVALGLGAAHRAGLVHRDVKPDNILIGTDRARVVDFGLATVDDEARAAGTPSYLAPEVLAGESASPASDQFSFGVTFHEALYGRRPHRGATRDELRASAKRAVEDIASDGRVPGWLAAIVKRTLAAAPGDRFASLDAIAGELARDRRRRRLALVMIAGALAIGGGAGALAMRAGTTTIASCDGSARRAAVWNDAAANRIRAQLGDAPWASRAVASLAGVAGAWEPSFRRVCEATRVRGEQSDRLLELRMRCLERVLDRFAALTEAFATPLDRSARVEATSAVGQLGSPAACETLTDPAELALPSDPARRERARIVEHALDRAWAAYALGRYAVARTEITAVERDARALDAPALHAASLVLAASVEARIGAPAKARELLDRALAATATAGAHELELAVWTRLLRHELFSGDPAHTIEWSPFAHAAAARAGRDGAELDGIIAEALRESGELERARTHARRALASRDPLRDDQRALFEMNLGSIELASGATALATEAFTRALALARRSLGDDHPTLAIYLDKLAEAARARGDLEAALSLHERSLALRRGAFGPDDRAVATALFHRAETLLAARRLDEAEADLAAAEALRARLFGATSPRLGELAAARGDVAAARDQHDKARTLYDRAATLDPRLDLAARRKALADRR